MPRRSLTEYVEGFSRLGSEPAYVQRRGYRTLRWSYRQIAETACQFARELEARKVAEGNRVILWGENCGEWVAAFWGCLLRGVVVVPMDRIASGDFVRRVCQEVDAKLLVCSQELAHLVPDLPAIILESLPEIVAQQDRSSFAPVTSQRQDPVEIIFTSGTTAEPKGVVLTHGNILANLEPLESEIRKYRKYERFVHPLRFLSLLPLSHVFGQFLGLFVPQLLGGTVVFQDTLNPSEVIRTIRREQISVLGAVPRLLESLRDKLERDLEAVAQLDRFREQFRAAEKASFWKRWWRFRQIHRRFGWKFWALISGGAALDPEIETFWSRLGFVVIQGYGLTETASLVSVNHPFRLGKGSIGQVLPGREIKLAADGEILVRGESIAASYWKEQKLQPVAGEEGWFRTGDLGALDEKGNLYFKGRGKNVIVTPAGMNIYPEDLEAVLRRQPEVRDCVVIGIARGGNEEPCAVLLLRPEAGEAEQIIRRANQSLAEYQQIRQWFVWPGADFPRSSTQKPRINVIQETVAAQIPGKTVAGEAALAGASSPLAELLGRMSGRMSAALSPDAKLETDLNLSSIDRVELLSALEDRYQIELGESRFTAATTVGELEQMLRQPPPSRSEYLYPRWAQRWPIAIVRFAAYYLLTWPATLLLGYPRVRGRENLRGFSGPALIVVNHVTTIDIGFVLAALPARLRHRLAVAMVGERLQQMRHPPPEMGWFQGALQRIGYILVTALFNVFPLPKLTGFRESFEYAGESADRGYSVVVFPEGELTRDGRIAPFRTGIGILAKKLNLPIIPIRINGLFELRQAGKKLAPPWAIQVSIGPPVRFNSETEPERIAEQLRDRVVSLGSPASDVA
ncbi:MAG: AMP-binding protein [Acidobacteria bacterium]|nr:AMP-binding protein [Acidobacteriota bacterium]